MSLKISSDRYPHNSGHRQNLQHILPRHWITGRETCVSAGWKIQSLGEKLSSLKPSEPLVSREEFWRRYSLSKHRVWRRQSNSTNGFRTTVKTLGRAQLSHALLTITGWPPRLTLYECEGCGRVAAAIPQFVSNWQPMRNTSGHLIYNSKQLLCVCAVAHTQKAWLS